MVHINCVGFFLFLTMIALSRSFRFGPVVRVSTMSRALCMAVEVKTMEMRQFAEILKGDERKNYQIVDVREPNELEVASIQDKDIIKLPLMDAATWTQQVEAGKLLDADKPVICLCHHGMRSLKVANFLGGKGFTVYNLKGGIHVYSLEVDSSVPIY